MKQLLRKPFLFAVLLSLPLWVVFNNFLIAFISAMLIAFMASMCYSLYVLKGRTPDPAPSEPASPAASIDQLPTANTKPSDLNDPDA